MEYENDIITQTETQTETQTQNQVLKQEYSRFSDYSTSKSKKDYEEYEIIQTYTPKKQKKQTEFNQFVDEQNSYSLDKEIITYEKVSPKLALNKSKKIFICICCAIAITMGVLSITNASNINNLNYSNLSKTQEIANLGQEITKIDQVIQGMTSEEAVDKKAEENGMTPVQNTTQIELIQKQQITKHQGKTNFFDKICNFFSKLFGG